MADRVHRITQFKLPKHEDQLALIEQYKILNANQKKDGKPYILSCVVGLAEKDPRSQDYTVICKTEFASLDDMKYYDQECEAHKVLKAAAKNFTVDGIMTTYFTPKFIGP